MEKINIAELLKDCPKGMELYSPLCGKCVFDRLNMGTIICKKQNTQEITFTSEGYYMIPVFDNCECMIFPSKDQRDWSKFQRPFKDGDIVITTLGNTAIIKEPAEIEYFTHCVLVDAHLHTVPATVCVERLATEEEKQKLFDAIKDNGYKWNEETKTLEELYHYPKTLYECCAILGLTELGIIGGYRRGLLTQFRNLLICRDAYWKIAGNWKPDIMYGDLYCIGYDGNVITWKMQGGCRLLVFPTEEMRDAFLENFKELIKECISLL